MKKEHIFKATIVLTGTGLTYLKYNLTEFLNFEYLLPVISVLIVIFIATVFMLNKKFYQLKTIRVNPKLKSLLSGSKTEVLNINLKEKIDSTKPQKNKNTKIIEHFLWILCATGFGIFLGFYFKTFDSKALRKAMSFETEWQSELYLKRIKAKNYFFEFDGSPSGGFDFNWFAFIIGVSTLVLIYFIVKRTTVLTVLKTKIEPYLK